jgi:hypothetical protein
MKLAVADAVAYPGTGRLRVVEGNLGRDRASFIAYKLELKLQEMR